MSERIEISGLKVAPELYEIVGEIAPGTGVETDHFWQELAAITDEFVPRNRELLAVRDDLQAKVDAWHNERAGQAHDEEAYLAFLKEIGYLLL